MDDLGPVSHRFISQRIALHYLDWGNLGRPSLLLVHGAQDHAHSWDWVAREMRFDWHVICPDLRGHGDSGWSPDGSYVMPYYVADLAQLIHQSSDTPVAIVAHSLGGAVALRYAGIYPERVHRLVIIEGLGLSPHDLKPPKDIAERWRGFIDQRRSFAGKLARRYTTLEQACARMRERNKHLSDEQVRHLTVHGTSRNEDGSYSWKFDNYTRASFPITNAEEDVHALWGRIRCPVWLVHGSDSWAHHPETDGRAERFKNVTVKSYDGAGHWVHHDRFKDFVADLKAFLQPQAETGTINGS